MNDWISNEHHNPQSGPQEIGFFSYQTTDISEDLASYIMSFYKNRINLKASFDCLRTASQILVQSWNPKGDFHKFMFGDATDDWKRQLYALNCICHGMVQTPNNAVLMLLTDQLVQVSRKICKALRSISSAGGEIAHEDHFRSQRMKAPDFEKFVAGSEIFARCMHAVKQFMLLELQVNDAHRWDKFYGYQRRTKITAMTGRTWSIGRTFFDFIWPTLNTLLTDEGNIAASVSSI